MRLAGFRDEDVEESLSVGQAAELLGVHRNTLRNWIKDGRLSAAEVGKEWRIGRDVFLSTVFHWRTQLYQPARLSWRELAAAIPHASKLLHMDPEELQEAWGALEEYKYVILAVDGWDRQILVAPTLPDDPGAGVLRRMLMDDHHPRICPWCEKHLPRMVFAGNAPPPQHLWELSGFEHVESKVSLSFDLMSWSIYCSSCGQKRHFVNVDRPGPSKLAHAAAKAVLEAVEVSGTSRRPPTNAYAHVDLLGSNPNESSIDSHLAALRKEIEPFLDELPGREDNLTSLRPRIIESLIETVGPCFHDTGIDIVLSYVIKALGGNLTDWRMAWRRAIDKLRKQAPNVAPAADNSP